MNEQGIQERRIAAGPLLSRQSAMPLAILILLSPVLTELLMGSLRITTLWLLIPQMGVYGLGALIIRDIARRQGRGWSAILGMGIALALVIECVILQTSLTPQFFALAQERSFGWAYGVHWVYLLAMLGYESTYAVVIPIQLTELLFPAQRRVPWLSGRGLAVATSVFVVASIGVRLLWSRGALPRFGESSYQVPLLYPALALLITAGLVVLTLKLPRATRPVRETTRRAVSPWLAGALAFLFGIFWWVLVLFAYLDRAMLPGFSPVVPILLGLGWAALAFLVVRWLSAAQDWQAIHRLALIFGAMLASMLGGSLSIITAQPIDLLGKLVLDLIAVILFSMLCWRMRRARAADKSGTAMEQ